MTNLSSSFRKKPNKLIIIHGLNNSERAFDSLKTQLQEFGFDTHFLTLPCHGENRFEAKNFDEALQCFDKNMKAHSTEPYSVIAFSQGALYLQLWLNKNPDRLPTKQVLLAPALIILKQKMAEILFSSLPAWIPTKSFSPRSIRRFAVLSIRDYKILMGGLKKFRELKPAFNIPTLLMIDPKDELVDAVGLEREFQKRNQNLKLTMFPREYLAMGLGCHHILFHRDYFSQEDWKKFTQSIRDFLEMDIQERSS